MVAIIRKPAPAFTNAFAVVNGEIQRISLSDYKGQYVVLLFYPMDFSFVCPTELLAFSEQAHAFRAMNCEVLGCSTDSRFSHVAWTNMPRKKGGVGSLNIPLIADYTKEIAQSYDVLCADPEDEDNGVAFRGVFLIDRNGILRQKTINDMQVGRNVDEILRLVEAFQYTDEHGEVCPAGWRKGAPTLKENPKEAAAYFAQQNP